MPASTEPNSGLYHGWTLGESGWNAQMDANLLRLGRVGFHLSVLDRDLTTPPGTPANGDTYIPAATATGPWAGLEGQVVVWDDAAWVAYTPRTGWLAYIEDEQKLTIYRAGTWTTGISIQPVDSGLSGISPLDNTFIVGNGIEWTAESGATARASLGLGSAATYNIGTGGANVPLLNSANTWGANQTISVDNTAAFTSAAYGDAVFPLFNGQRARGSIASPAAVQVGDSIIYLQAIGYDGSAFSSNAGFIACRAAENWTTSAKGTEWIFSTTNVGAAVSNGKFFLRQGFYAVGVTGGDKGAGTINAVAVYDDNVLLTCYVLEAEISGQVSPETWDSYTLDLEIPEEPEQVEERPITRKVLRRQRVRDGARIVERLVEVDEPVFDDVPVVDELGAPVLHNGSPVVERVQRTERVVTRPARPARTEVRTHEPARRFAARAAQMLDPAQYAASWKATGYLPSMPSPAEWDAAGKKMAVGDIVQRLWETVELQAVHIDKLRQRIEALEAK